MRAPRDVFVSYAREDAPLANITETLLQGASVGVFIDVKHLKAGEDWREQVEHAISRARIVFVLWSSSSSSSQEVTHEWTFALDCQRRRLNLCFAKAPLVVPVLLDDTEMPDRLARYQALDLREQLDGVRNQLPRALLERLESLVPPRPISPVVPIGILLAIVVAGGTYRHYAKVEAERQYDDALSALREKAAERVDALKWLAEHPEALARARRSLRDELGNATGTEACNRLADLGAVEGLKPHPRDEEPEEIRVQSLRCGAEAQAWLGGLRLSSITLVHPWLSHLGLRGLDAWSLHFVGSRAPEDLEPFEGHPVEETTKACVLADLSFSHARLRDSSFVRCVLDEVTFESAMLDEVSFLGSVVDVDFRGATLRNVSFGESHIVRADLREAHVEGLYFEADVRIDRLILDIEGFRWIADHHSDPLPGIVCVTPEQLACVEGSQPAGADCDALRSMEPQTIVVAPSLEACGPWAPD